MRKKILIVLGLIIALALSIWIVEPSQLSVWAVIRVFSALVMIAAITYATMIVLVAGYYQTQRKKDHRGTYYSMYRPKYTKWQQLTRWFCRLFHIKKKEASMK